MLASLAGVLLLLIALVRLWPLPQPGESTDVVYRAEPEAIAIDEILQTSQSVSKPPPPPPPVPVESTMDFLVEEPELDFDVSLPDIADLTRRGPPGDGADEMTTSASLEEAARPVRFVEPEYTRDARRKRLKAEIVVQVLVSREGNVRETQILRRYLLGTSASEREAVDVIGYGLEEAAVTAARRWIFRPARLDGIPVESYYELTFSFGV